ncbi:MAG: TetR/AcrR family transcriptional regulator C-terminal domain-containing protein [Myxococcaceae bacterium]
MKLADEEGLEGVSMRRLAQELGVEAMSLYHHVKNKDEILDGMVDLVFGQMLTPPGELGWKDALRHRCVSVREVLLRHRWALSVIESRKAPGPKNLDHHDAVLGCFKQAGFSLPLTGHAFAALNAYTYGFVHTELQLPMQGATETQALAKDIFSKMPPGLFKNLVAFTVGHVLQPGYSFANEFDWGLEFILDGLERALQKESA